MNRDYFKCSESCFSCSDYVYNRSECVVSGSYLAKRPRARAGRAEKPDHAAQACLGSAFAGRMLLFGNLSVLAGRYARNPVKGAVKSCLGSKSALGIDSIQA